MALSGHLLHETHMAERGRTAVMLVAVFCVWAYTSFEATFLPVSRSRTQRMLLAVMLVGLFMNAGIARPFGTAAWGVRDPVPGHPGRTLHLDDRETGTDAPRALRGVAGVDPPLRTPVDCGGDRRTGRATAVVGAAASIDLIGTWLAHPSRGACCARSISSSTRCT